MNKSLQVGDTIPPFMLFDQDGAAVSQQDLIGKISVIYFYPKDDTPGCTKQACDFRDISAQLKTQQVQLFGISADKASSHQKFIQKYGLNFQLLCDFDRTLAQQWGLITTSNFFGRLLAKVMRTTFLIGPDGTILWMEKNARVNGHIARVLHALEQIQSKA